MLSAPSHGRSRTRPPAYIHGPLRGIVGIEIRVERVEGKAKLNQNHSAADRLGVTEALLREGGAQAAQVAAWMAQCRSSR